MAKQNNLECGKSIGLS